jgi:hypothetical protein
MGLFLALELSRTSCSKPCSMPGGRNLGGGAARVGGVLDMAVGPTRFAHGDAATVCFVAIGEDVPGLEIVG